MGRFPSTMTASSSIPHPLVAQAVLAGTSLKKRENYRRAFEDLRREGRLPSTTPAKSRPARRPASSRIASKSPHHPNAKASSPCRIRQLRRLPLSVRSRQPIGPPHAMKEVPPHPGIDALTKPPQTWLQIRRLHHPVRVMQASWPGQDHLTTCFRHREVKK